MTNKTYKAIFVTPELHNEVKMLAVKNKLTMIEFLDILVYDFKRKGIVVDFSHLPERLKD